MKSYWVNNEGTTIEFIDSILGSTNKEIPLVIIPGLSESTEDYIPLIRLLSPRRCVAISLRGRGKSDGLETG